MRWISCTSGLGGSAVLCRKLRMSAIAPTPSVVTAIPPRINGRKRYFRGLSSTRLLHDLLRHQTELCDLEPAAEIEDVHHTLILERGIRLDDHRQVGIRGLVLA